MFIEINLKSSLNHSCTISCLFACLALFVIPGLIKGQIVDLQASNPSSLPPAHGYSHIVIAPPGRLVSISGQVAMDSTGKIVGGGNFKAQCIQVHKNLSRALQSVDLSFENVIRTDMYVTTLDHLSILRECRARYLPNEVPPTATLHKVEALFHPKLMLEIAVIAVLPTESSTSEK